jgi:hypothetical protein
VIARKELAKVNCESGERFGSMLLKKSMTNNERAIFDSYQTVSWTNILRRQLFLNQYCSETPSKSFFNGIGQNPNPSSALARPVPLGAEHWSGERSVGLARGAPTYSHQAGAEHFQQCAEFLLLRNRGLGPLAMTVLPVPFARRAAATACAAVQSTASLFRRW